MFTAHHLWSWLALNDDVLCVAGPTVGDTEPPWQCSCIFTGAAPIWLREARLFSLSKGTFCFLSYCLQSGQQEEQNKSCLLTGEMMWSLKLHCYVPRTCGLHRGLYYWIILQNAPREPMHSALFILHWVRHICQWVRAARKVHVVIHFGSLWMVCTQQSDLCGHGQMTECASHTSSSTWTRKSKICVLV